MTISAADLVIIALYFLLMLVLAYLTRRSKTFQDFAVGKHSIPALMVFSSLAATIVGPGFSIGFAAKGWQSGYLYYFLVLAYPIQVILVGLFLAPRLSQHRDCTTLGDVMRKKYGSVAQLLTGITSVGVCVGFAAVMGKAGGITLHAVTGWSLGLCIAVVTASTALITFSGGLRATIATEGVQFLLKTLVIAAIVLLMAFETPESLQDISSRAATLTLGALKDLNFWQLAGIAISFMVGEALIPPYANRALAAKSTTESKVGFVLAGVFCIVWLAMVAFLGVSAHGFLPPSTSGDDVLILGGQAVLPAGMFGLLLAAMIAIVMSSQESVLNAGAVAFVRDIVAVVSPQSERTMLLLAKISTLCFAAIAIYAAEFAPSILDGLLIMYSIWAPTILVPLAVGLFIQQSRPLAGWLSMLSGGALSLVWQSVLHEPYGIPAILVGLVAAIFAYTLGHIAGRTASVQAGGKLA